MKTKAIKSLILSAVGAVAFSSITVGTTFALFTSNAEATIKVGSGKIDVNLEAKNLQTYSAKYQTDHYESVATAINGTFTNGGTASLVNGNLELSKVTPGDRVTFSVDFSNTTNVNYQYRLLFEAVSSDKTLATALQIKTDISGSEQTYKYLNKYISSWEYREAGDNDIDSLTFDVELPIEVGNTYQEKEITYQLSIEAIQGNAHVEDEAKTEYLVMTYEQLKELSIIPGITISLQNDIDVPVSTEKSGTSGAMEIFEPEKMEIAAGNIINGNGHKLVLPEFKVTPEELNLIATYVVKIGGDNVELRNLEIDASRILNQGGSLIDCNNSDNIKIDNCSFIGDPDYAGNGKVLGHVSKNIVVSNTTSKDTFAFIYGNDIDKLDGTITVVNSFISTDIYTINVGDGVSGNAKIHVKDSILAGWTSFAGLDKAIFDNVQFKHSSTKEIYDAYMNYFINYNYTEFNNCTFNVEVSNTTYYGFFINPDGKTNDPDANVRNDATKTVFNNCKVNYVTNGEGTSLEDLGRNNVIKFKEDHDFKCTINGVQYKVTGTEATEL